MKEEQERTPLRAILQNFLNHIEKLDSEELEGSYEKEFQELKLFSEILKSSKQFSCSHGEKEVNRKKNRYKDILPFDESRVILEGYAGVPGSDYINANYIKGASGSPAYIASQAPLPHTVNDFWRMVVQCEVQVIVMACNEEEAGKHKCENYWVEREGEERQFGMVAIRLIKASVVCPDFLVRTMRLKYTNSQSSLEERTVCQFHYSAWPDHGVPPLVRPLLDMVRLVRDTQASETLPVLVHCSAGCGRTGTICAIDYVWGLLRAGKLTKDFSLFKLVRDMRRQRIAMVQTKEQYILVHHAVKELFCEQLRMIDSHPYENIDVNGMPLVKESSEPMHAAVALENGCEEKQDSKEKDDCLKEKADISPIPNKKKHHTASSKHEKEVENLTEKQRSIVEQSSNSDNMSSLLQKPRIAKLKALFERAPPNRETRNMQTKHKLPQQVTRSHSLGAVRKSESVNQPIPCKGILRVPQPTQGPPAQSVRPAIPIKRSKSLKVLGSEECYKLSVASSHHSTEPLRNKDSCESKPFIPPKKLIQDKFKDRMDLSDVIDIKTQSRVHVDTRRIGEDSHPVYNRRRRSLESCISDDSNSVRMQTVSVNIQQKHSLFPHEATQGCVEFSHSPDASNVLQIAHCNGTAERTELQQNLSLEAQKEISAIVAGLGVRERRNSFRQAINTSKDRTPISSSSSSSSSAGTVREFDSAWLSSTKSSSVSDCVVVASEKCRSKTDSGISGSLCHNVFSTPYQTSSRGSQKTVQQPSHSVQLVRAKSDRHVTKDSITTSGSVRLKGTQLLDFPKELVPCKSNRGRPTQSGFAQESKNIILASKSRPAMWPVAATNVRTDVAGLGACSMPLQINETTRGRMENSGNCLLSKYKKSVEFPADGKVILPRNILVQPPNIAPKEINAKLACLRNVECSERVRMDHNTSSRAGNVNHKEVPYVTLQSKSIPSSSRSSQMNGPSTGVKIGPYNINTPVYPAYKASSSCSQLKTSCDKVLDDSRKKYDHHVGDVPSVVPRKDDVETSKNAVVTNESDVVSYGLVAGVQLRRGSRDDLALCGSGPAVPPRVRRHASVVLLRHSLIETSDGTPMTPLTVWNSTQQGEASSTKYVSNQQPPTWNAASEVDLDIIAANFKLQSGEESTSVMRTLEALHLRKLSPQSVPVVPSAQYSLQHHHSPTVKKQHYL